MEIKQLAYFVETCKYMSFSDAAKALYLTPQALSKSIHNLESELGGEVFSRTGNAITLTDYGALLLQRGRELLKSYDVLLGDMKYATHHFSGGVRVGFSYGVLDALPPEKMMDFMRAYPELSLDMEEMPDDKLEERLLAGGLDFAYCVGAPGKAGLFRSERVCTSPLSAVLMKENPLYQRGRFTLEDLREQKFIVHSHNQKIIERVYTLCRARGFEPERLIRSSHLELNKRVLWSMGGVSLGAYNLWKDYPYTGSVGCIPMVGEDAPRWEIYLVAPADRQMTPGGKTMAEFLSGTLREIVEA